MGFIFRRKVSTNISQEEAEAAGTLVFSLEISPSPVEAGDPLTGTVQLSSEDATVKVRNVFLLLYGEAKTGWSRTKKWRRNQHQMSQDRQVFFREFITLWDQITLDNEPHRSALEPFTFTYVLPPDLPSTFVCEDATIRYFAQATVAVDGQSTKVFRRYFSVRGRQKVDFCPISFEKQLQSAPGRWCARKKTSDIFCSFRLSQSAYKTGQSVVVSGSVKNESKRRKLGGLTAQLVRIVRCTSTTPSGHIESKANETILGRLDEWRVTGEGQILEWTSEKIPIPADATPTISGNICRLIRVSYVMKFWAIVSGHGHILLGELSVSVV